MKNDYSTILLHYLSYRNTCRLKMDVPQLQQSISSTINVQFDSDVTLTDSTENQRLEDHINENENVKVTTQ